MSATAQMHLLYTRFVSVSQQVLPLLSELERRARAHPQELSALLSECHSAYFTARKSLITARIMEEIKGLDPSRSELVELVSISDSFLLLGSDNDFSLLRQGQDAPTSSNSARTSLSCFATSSIRVKRSYSECAVNVILAFVFLI
jgi:conserved oligomeric Golgi complex subunit 3